MSATALNDATRLPVVLPITTGGDFARRIGFAVQLSGIKTTGIVRCDQPRALDLVARGGRRIESLASVLMDQILARLLPIFS